MSEVVLSEPSGCSSTERVCGETCRVGSSFRFYEAYWLRSIQVSYVFWKRMEEVGGLKTIAMQEKFAMQDLC